MGQLGTPLGSQQQRGRVGAPARFLWLGWAYLAKTVRKPQCRGDDFARPAGLKQSAMRTWWPQGGRCGARQNAPLEMSPSKIYGFVHIRGFLPEMPIISDQPFRALSRGGGS